MLVLAAAFQPQAVKRATSLISVRTLHPTLLCRQGTRPVLSDLCPIPGSGYHGHGMEWHSNSIYCGFACALASSRRAVTGRGFCTALSAPCFLPPSSRTRLRSLFSRRLHGPAQRHSRFCFGVGVERARPLIGWLARLEILRVQQAWRIEAGFSLSATTSSLSYDVCSP